jgi:hypothetical protein
MTSVIEIKAFPWTLSKDMKKTIYAENTALYEYPDVGKVRAFIKAKLGIITFTEDHYYQNKRFKTEYDQVSHYYQSAYSYKKKAFIVKVALPKHKWGRVIPKNYASLSIMHRPTRHTFCHDGMIDIDMINSSQKIFLEISIKNNHPAPCLLEYCEDRKRIFREMSECFGVAEEMCKKFFISVSFGGSVQSWKKKHNIDETIHWFWLNKFEDEIKGIMEIIYANNGNMIEDIEKSDPEYFKRKKFVKTEEDIIRAKKKTCMALFYQTIERNMQEAMISYLVEEKGFELNKMVPCQDGFMILKELWYEEILKECEESAFEKLGLRVPLKQKEFDERFELIPETSKPWEEITDVKGIANTVYDKYGDFIKYYNQEFYVFFGEAYDEINETFVNGKWYSAETASSKILRIISEYTYHHIVKEIEMEVLQQEEKEKWISILRKNVTEKFSLIIKHIISVVSRPSKKFDSNPFLLGFNNGVYDLLKFEFRVYGPEDCVTMSTGYDYEVPDYNDEKWSNLRDEVIDFMETIMPDENHRNLLLKILASGLDGLLYQKFFMLNGAGGNGKGRIIDLMTTVLGEQYATKPRKEILADLGKSNQASEDVFTLKNKRFVAFEEVSEYVNASILKILTGGGNINARQNYKSNEVFSLNCTMCALFNEAFQINFKEDGKDALLRRLIDLFFTRNFTSDKTKIGKTEKRKGYEVKYVKGDSKYESTQWMESVKLVFLDLLIGVYKTFSYTDKDNGKKGMNFEDIPEDVIRNTESFLDQQNKYAQIVPGLICFAYEKVDEENPYLKQSTTAYLKLKDIFSYFKETEEYKDFTKKEKRDHNYERFCLFMYSKYGSEFVKQNRNKVMCLYGYRIATREEREQDCGFNITEELTDDEESLQQYEEEEEIID